jgi:hypothetical protein
MTDTKWLQQQISELKQDETSFKMRSYLDGILSLAQEQEKRIQQSQDEIDGRTWSPDRW